MSAEVTKCPTFVIFKEFFGNYPTFGTVKAWEKEKRAFDSPSTYLSCYWRFYELASIVNTPDIMKGQHKVFKKSQINLKLRKLADQFKLHHISFVEKHPNMYGKIKKASLAILIYFFEFLDKNYF